MPRKTYIKKRTYKKRTFKPKVRNYMPLTAPIPEKRLVKLKYSDLIYLNPGAGYSNAALHTWRANSINDPDYTTGGHQPLYHDQFQALYDTYRVLGSKITVKCLSTDKDIVYGVFLSDSVNSVTDVLALQEQKQCVKRTHLTNSSSYSVIHKTFSGKKFYGAISAMDSDKQAGFGSNPADAVYYNMWVGSPTYSTQAEDPAAINFEVQMEFIVLMTGVKQLAQS